MMKRGELHDMCFDEARLCGAGPFCATAFAGHIVRARESGVLAPMTRADVIASARMWVAAWRGGYDQCEADNCPGQDAVDAPREAQEWACSRCGAVERRKLTRCSSCGAERKRGA